MNIYIYNKLEYIIMIGRVCTCVDVCVSVCVDVCVRALYYTFGSKTLSETVYVYHAEHVCFFQCVHNAILGLLCYCRHIA